MSGTPIKVKRWVTFLNKNRMTIIGMILVLAFYAMIFHLFFEGQKNKRKEAENCRQCQVACAPYYAAINNGSQCFCDITLKQPEKP